MARAALKPLQKIVWALLLCGLAALLVLGGGLFWIYRDMRRQVQGLVSAMPAAPVRAAASTPDGPLPTRELPPPQALLDSLRAMNSPNAEAVPKGAPRASAQTLPAPQAVPSALQKKAVSFLERPDVMNVLNRLPKDADGNIDVKAVLQSLSPEQRAMVQEAMKDPDAALRAMQAVEGSSPAPDSR